MSIDTRENKPNILVYVVAYEAEKFITNVLQRTELAIRKVDSVCFKILVSDDYSKDSTYEIAEKFKSHNPQIDLEIIKQQRNLGYGGNQKFGYMYSIQNRFSHVILMHGDGQYAPEEIPNLVHKHLETKASITLASRMINKIDALKGGMPFYKFVGNMVLTKIQNYIMGSNLSEFHTGYRMYSTKYLEQIDFAKISNDFHFDTQILNAAIMNKHLISEISIKTHYGEEISRVNGIKYAFNVLRVTFHDRISQKR